MTNKPLVISLFCLLTTLSAQAAHHAKPLVVNDKYIKLHGSILTEEYTGTIDQPAISINTPTPVIIDGAHISGPGTLINAINTNLTVRNTVAIGTNPNSVGKAKGAFINAVNIVNLDVEGCTVTGTGSGVYVGNYAGNHTHNQTIKIINNTFTNFDGRLSDGNNGYQTPTGPTNAFGIQLVYANNLPGLEIAWNEIVNTTAFSPFLFNISFIDAGGTATSHALIHDNYLQGAYGYSGMFQITGFSSDAAGGTSAFNDVYANQFVSSSNYAVNISAGHDNMVYQNRVVSSGYAPDGTFIGSSSGTGLINNNNVNQPATVFFNNNMHDNFVGFINSNGRNDWSLPGQNNAVNNNISWQPIDNTDPTPTNEATEYQRWLQKRGMYQLSANNKELP